VGCDIETHQAKIGLAHELGGETPTLGGASGLAVASPKGPCSRANALAKLQASPIKAPAPAGAIRRSLGSFSVR
jgi:hypothetical protein